MNKGGLFIQPLVGGAKRDDGPTYKRPNIGEKVARTLLGVRKKLHGIKLIHIREISCAQHQLLCDLRHPHVEDFFRVWSPNRIIPLH
jgi:hypothetical protein